MNKYNFNKIAGISGMVTVMIGLAGCSTPFANKSVKDPVSRVVSQPAKDNSKPVAYDTSWNQKGSQIGSVNNSQTSYGLESKILGGQAWFVQTNANACPNELDHVFFNAFETTLIFDHDGKQVGKTNEFVYVPTQLLRNDGTKKERAEFLTTGSHAKSAKRTDLEILSKATKTIPMGIFTSNQKDVPYNIPTMSINGNSYFVPFNQEQINYANFVEIPKTGTVQYVSPDGKISLLSTNGIYGPKKMLTSEWIARGTNTPSINHTNSQGSVTTY